MNRMYTNTHQALERRVVALYVKAAIGATGAVTLDSTNSKGIASMVRNSTGKYTITLSDKYVQFLSGSVARVLASGTPAVVGGHVFRSADVGAETPTVVVDFVNGSGAAVDPANGTTLFLKLELKATSV